MHAAARRKHTPYPSGGGTAARTRSVTRPPAKPPRLAPRFASAKKRPRSVTGIARPMMSIQAGIRTPPTPVTTSSVSSRTPSVSAGARPARKKAASASPTNGTRSQTV